MSWLSRLIDALLGPPKSDVITPAPRVAPDPEQAAAIKRRQAELDYRPEHGFIRDLPEDTQ